MLDAVVHGCSIATASGLCVCAGALALAACLPHGAAGAFFCQGGRRNSAIGRWSIPMAAISHLNDGVVPYDLNTPLFSDYAHKLRTIWMPRRHRPPNTMRMASFDFPVGTIISKTFYYPLPARRSARLEVRGAHLRSVARLRGSRKATGLESCQRASDRDAYSGAPRQAAGKRFPMFGMQRRPTRCSRAPAMRSRWSWSPTTARGTVHLCRARMKTNARDVMSWI